MKEHKPRAMTARRGTSRDASTSDIRTQTWKHYLFYLVFALVTAGVMLYYLSDTLLHFTTPYQFPINSFARFPLTYLVFPAEIFSFAFALYFIYNLFTDKYREPEPLPLLKKEKVAVAVLLPVYNEPKSIVERTITACKGLRWPGTVTVYLLDDSTNDADKKNMAELAKRFDCTIVRRKDRAGYKAGNINHAVSTVVTEEYFTIFDSDQAPEPEFLEATMDYFSADDVAFVQAPQHFVQEGTALERAAKIGANIFFQSQCVSKARDKALPFCGTNAIIRTKLFKEIGGFAYYTATEDIDLGLRLNAAGYHGIYVPKLLVHGYAPPDFIAYSSQQYRWANGNLAILREHFWRILKGDFSFRYQVHQRHAGHHDDICLAQFKDSQ
ncbi:glycosyltransferase [Candidatus Woesearchaeota archaeon]|nr:glycosyltransferase [Candidatus Woesearchaeota archaeon]